MQENTSLKAKGEMVKVHIQHLAMGSLSSEQGDTTLSYTDGVSASASDLCALTMGNAASDYASMYFIGNSATKGLSIVHVQGGHVVMGGGTRAYTTRVAYECSEACLDSSGGYLPIVSALDRMKFYEKTEWGTDDSYTLKPKRQMQLSQDEELLARQMELSVKHNCRIFVKLADSDKRKADDLRHSPKLAAMLNAIDSLPADIRIKASMAFATNAMACATLLPMIRIVAHHDSLDNWGSAADNSVIIDWTRTHITLLSAPKPEAISKSDQPDSSGQSDESDKPLMQARASRKDGCGLAVAAVVALGAIAFTLIWG